LRVNHPNIELYSTDNSHPTVEGSMAAAYTFYVAIFKKDPTLVPFNGALSTTNAAAIKLAVKNVVYNNQDTYLIDVNDNFADFKASKITGNAVQFQNNTANATKIQWSFGDGSTSTLQNPTHQFATNGSYTVKLTLTVCGKEYTKTKQIVVAQLSNKEVWTHNVKLFPNPTKHTVSLTNLNYDKVAIFDLSGRRVKDLKIENTDYLEFNVSNLANGSYFIHVTKDNKAQSFPFIKN